MKNIDISIIIPVYNGEKYIKKLIDKVLSSPLSKEIIVIDSSSSDNSLSILKQYGKKINLLALDKNKGVSYARNLGIAKAQGNFIGFIDQDDDIETDMFLKMYTKAQEENSDICVCNYDEFYEIKTEHNKSKYHYSFKKDILENYLIDNISPAIWDKIYKKEFIKTLKFNETLNIGEDILFNLEAFLKTKNVVFVNEYLYHYFQQDKSVMHSLSSRHLQFLEITEKLAPETTRYLKENYCKAYEFFELEMFTRAIHSISILVNKENKKEAKAYLKSIITQDKLNKIIKNSFFSKSIKIEMIILKLFGLSLHLSLIPFYQKIRNKIRN